MPTPPGSDDITCTVFFGPSVGLVNYVPTRLEVRVRSVDNATRRAGPSRTHTVRATVQPRSRAACVAATTTLEVIRSRPTLAVDGRRTRTLCNHSHHSDHHSDHHYDNHARSGWAPFDDYIYPTKLMTVQNIRNHYNVPHDYEAVPGPAPQAVANFLGIFVSPDDAERFDDLMGVLPQPPITFVGVNNASALTDVEVAALHAM